MNAREQILELRNKGLAYTHIEIYVNEEAQKLGFKKGLTAARLRQIANGSGVTAYERAITAAYERLK